jgi:hypothetical protein
MLADGVASSAPKFRKSLLRRAMSLLDNGPDSYDPRLGSFLEPDTYDIFDDEISRRLKEVNSPAAYAAYGLLGHLLNSHPDWASTKVLDHWPGDAEQVLKVFERMAPIRLSPELIKRVIEAQEHVSPRRVAQLQHRVANRRGNMRASENFRKRIAEWVLLPSGYVRVFGVKGIQVGFLNNSAEQYCAMEFVPIGGETGNFSFHGENKSNGWSVVRAVSDFADDPNKESLAAILEAASNSGMGEVGGLGFPWPVYSVLKDWEEGCPIASLIQEAREGRFGDISDWLQAEKRWVASGFAFDDFVKWNSGRYLNPEIADVGAPAISDVVWRPKRDSRAPITEFTSTLELARQLESITKRECIIDVLLTKISQVSTSEEVVRKSACEYLLDEIANYPNPAWSLHHLMQVSEAWENDAFLRLLERCSRAGERYWARAEAGISQIDVSDRWRGLLPVFADWYIDECAGDEAAPVKRPDIAPRAGDSPEVLAATTLVNFANNGFSTVTVPQLVNAIENRGLGATTVHVLLKKMANSAQRMDLLLEMVRREARSGDAARRGYLDVLQDEIEAEPSPLTRGSEIARLGLPSL